jgi:hypothetical protein
VSLSATFPNDIPLSSIELYDPSVVRTIFSEFVFPWKLEELYTQYDFYTSLNFNSILDKVYDNLDYIKGFSSLYNNVIPIDSTTCDVYDQVGKTGLYIDDTYEVTYTPTSLIIYKLGVLYQQIDKTSFGKFVDIKSVMIVDDFIYIIDGNYILKVDITTNPALFVTFFGGYGGQSTSYKFRTPTIIKFDETSQRFYIWDRGNKVIKIYTKELSFIDIYDLGDALGMDIIDGVIYKLTGGEFTNTESGATFRHEVETPNGIIIDNTQSGFLWIYNVTQILKYTIGGLLVGTYDMTRISDVARHGTKLYVIDFNNAEEIVDQLDVVIANLDYSFTQTISTTDEHKFSLSDTYIHPDEFASDWVINDTMYKVFDTMDDFNLSLTGVFVANLDAGSNLGSITTESRPISGVDIDCSFYQTQDEIISCSSLQRPIKDLYDLMDYTRIRLTGLETIDSLSGVGGGTSQLCWSLGVQSCEGVSPQLFNTNFTPLSFIELSNPIFECDPLTSCCLSSSFVQ